MQQLERQTIALHAGDTVHLLHIVPISLFHAVVHHSEQEEQMLVQPVLPFELQMKQESCAATA